MATTRDGIRAGERQAKKPFRSCPICGRPAAFATRPFCSKRCADIDLYRWLRGAYTIPVGRETETGENDEDWQHPTEIPDA
jgi:uncharacterized protein